MRWWGDARHEKLELNERKGDSAVVIVDNVENSE